MVINKWDGGRGEFTRARRGGEGVGEVYGAREMLIGVRRGVRYPDRGKRKDGGRRWVGKLIGGI